MNNHSLDEILENAQYELSENSILASLDLLEEIKILEEFNIEIQLLKARLIDLNRNEIRGIIGYEAINIERNKIRNSTLVLLNLIKKTSKKTSSESEKTSFILEMISIIDTTFNTWKAQTELKEKLIRLLEERFDKPEYDTPYEFFEEFYDKMNIRELRLHKTIRGYTENIILEKNLRALEILKEHPILKQTIPQLQYLEQHLRLWKSKYDSIFVKDPATCLIFVGLEEGMKFPPNLLDELKAHIERESS